MEGIAQEFQDTSRENPELRSYACGALRDDWQRRNRWFHLQPIAKAGLFSFRVQGWSSTHTWHPATPGSTDPHRGKPYGLIGQTLSTGGRCWFSPAPDVSLSWSKNLVLDSPDYTIQRDWLALPFRWPLGICQISLKRGRSFCCVLSLRSGGQPGTSISYLYFTLAETEPYIDFQGGYNKPVPWRFQIFYNILDVCSFFWSQLLHSGNDFLHTIVCLFIIGCVIISAAFLLMPSSSSDGSTDDLFDSVSSSSHTNTNRYCYFNCTSKNWPLEAGNMKIRKQMTPICTEAGEERLRAFWRRLTSPLQNWRPIDRGGKY